MAGTSQTIEFLRPVPHNNRTSEKQYKNKLREWRFNTKYKRHKTSRNRRNGNARLHSDIANRSIAAPTPEHRPQASGAPNFDDYGLQALGSVRADNHQFQYAEGLQAHENIFQLDHAGSANAPYLDAAENEDALDQYFPSGDLGVAEYGTANAASYPFQNPDYRSALDYNLQFTEAFQTPGTGDVENQHTQTSTVGNASTSSITPEASANNESDWRLSPPPRRSSTSSLTIGVRPGRAFISNISIAERVFSFAQQHVETSFAYGIWKENGSNPCTSLTCPKEDQDLPEVFFDLIRSAVLLFTQGSAMEAIHIVSKAFALVNPILKSGNVRALNFFWTSLVFLVQSGLMDIASRLIRYVYDMAKTLIDPEHPVVQMFKLLAHMDATELESLEALVHNTWQITADAFQKRLSKVHPEYIRHQCDLIFRIYGPKDAATAERRLCQLYKDCEEAPQSTELSRITILNARGYNYMNIEDWDKAVGVGRRLEEQAQLAQDMDLLVYQIAGMEIQARGYNELKASKLAVACLERAKPLIADRWGEDDPWRIELMVLQQKWLRENGEVKTADDIKADISSIAERIDAD